MSTSTTSTAVYTNSSLANFKSWATPISTAFSSLGWVQTADTGQVVWSTISTVPGVSTYVYEVWAMADTLQSTAPICVKVYYGTGASANYPYLYMQVGFGATWSAVTTYITLYSGNYYTTSTTAFTHNFSGDTDRIQMCLWRGTSAPTAFFSIERSESSSGVTTGDYLTALTGGYFPYGTSSSTSYIYHPQQQIVFASSNSIWGSSSPTIATEPDWITLQTYASSFTVSGNMNFGVVFPNIGNGFGNPVLGALCIKSADIADNVSFTSTLYGTSHTYLTINSAFNSTFVSRSNQSSPNNAIAMRWE